MSCHHLLLLVSLDTEDSGVVLTIPHPVIFLPVDEIASPTISPNITYYVGNLMLSICLIYPVDAVRLYNAMPPLQGCFLGGNWMVSCFRHPMQRVKKLYWARRGAS